jgi:hypothetical protein
MRFVAAAPHLLLRRLLLPVVFEAAGIGQGCASRPATWKHRREWAYAAFYFSWIDGFTSCLDAASLLHLIGDLPFSSTYPGR